MVYLTNSFSLQMLNLDEKHTIKTKTLTDDEARRELANGFVNALGHKYTARRIGAMLGMNLQMNRINIRANEKDTIIVGQLIGGRLPEGTEKLPSGSKIVFVKVRIIEK